MIEGKLIIMATKFQIIVDMFGNAIHLNVCLALLLLKNFKLFLLHLRALRSTCYLFSSLRLVFIFHICFPYTCVNNFIVIVVVVFMLSFICRDLILITNINHEKKICLKQYLWLKFVLKALACEKFV